MFCKIAPHHGVGKLPEVTLCNHTLFVAEHAPESGDSALAIRNTANKALGENLSGLSLETLNLSFTFVTDWAATMPRIVDASVSEKISHYHSSGLDVLRTS
jgi:hypothetical protein